MSEDQLEQEVGIEGVSMKLKNKGLRLSPEASADRESPVRGKYSIRSPRKGNAGRVNPG